MYRILLLTLLFAGTANASTPALESIERLQAALAERPDEETKVALAVAFIERAREVGDPVWYERAESTLDGIESYPAQRTRVAIRLGLHDFRAAAALGAGLLDARTAEDPTLIGLLLDAQVELGNYDAAWELAPQLLALAPGAPAALARASYLVELSGDPASAIELMERAMQATPDNRVEDHAWYLTHLAHLDRQLGDLANAQERLDRAHAIFPDYHYAVAESAKLAEAKGDQRAAANHTKRRCELAPHPECFYDLGIALQRADRHDEAREAFKRFVPAAQAESDGVDNANRQLIRYWLERDRVDEALRLAELERSRRADVHLRALAARVFVAAGKPDRAMEEIAAVTATGSVDPEVNADLEEAMRGLAM